MRTLKQSCLGWIVGPQFPPLDYIVKSLSYPPILVARSRMPAKPLCLSRPFFEDLRIDSPPVVAKQHAQLAVGIFKLWLDALRP